MLFYIFACEFFFGSFSSLQVFSFGESSNEQCGRLLRISQQDTQFVSALQKEPQAGVDGKRVTQNETRFTGQIFERGKPSNVMLTVRPRHILAVWDGKTVIDWQGDESRLSLKYGWPEEGEAGLYLTAYAGAFRITRIDYTPLSDDGE